MGVNVIDFKEYYTVVRKHVPFVTGVAREDIPRRIYSLHTVTAHSYVPPWPGAKIVVEFDGNIYWRVCLSDDLAPDGIKRIAYVVGGIRQSDVWFPEHTRNPMKIVNSLLNQQYQRQVIAKKVR